MAKALLSIEEACEELQLTKEQLIALVRQGAVRGFLDGKTHKFRRSDIDAYKKEAESGATLILEKANPSDSDITDKVDLADVESAPGVDDADQTSVLAPVDEKDEGTGDDEAVLEFSDADQTSMLAPVGEKGEGTGDDEAVFEFSEEELGLSLDGSDAVDSVLVADESESSLDILEVADESSDSATSVAKLDFADESSSGQAAGSTSTVTDFLGEAADEELETLDLEEVVETQDTILEEAPVEAVEIELDGAELDTHTAGTVPLTDEDETVGIEQEDATQAVDMFEDEVPVELGDEEELEAARARIVTGYGMETPSVAGNTCLILSIVLSLLGAAFLFGEITGTTNIITTTFADLVKESGP